MQSSMEETGRLADPRPDLRHPRTTARAPTRDRGVVGEQRNGRALACMLLAPDAFLAASQFACLGAARSELWP